MDGDERFKRKLSVSGDVRFCLSCFWFCLCTTDLISTAFPLNSGPYQSCPFGWQLDLELGRGRCWKVMLGPSCGALWVLAWNCKAQRHYYLTAPNDCPIFKSQHSQQMQRKVLEQISLSVMLRVLEYQPSVTSKTNTCHEKQKKRIKIDFYVLGGKYKCCLLAHTKLSRPNCHGWLPGHCCAIA